MHSIPFHSRSGNSGSSSSRKNNANSECLFCSALLSFALLENNSFLDFMLALTVFEFVWLHFSSLSSQGITKTYSCNKNAHSRFAERTTARRTEIRCRTNSIAKFNVLFKAVAEWEGTQLDNWVNILRSRNHEPQANALEAAAQRECPRRRYDRTNETDAFSHRIAWPRGKVQCIMYYSADSLIHCTIVRTFKGFGIIRINIQYRCRAN